MLSIKRTLYLLLPVAAAGLLQGCIENDIPYPHIEGIITRISVEDMEGEAVINRQSRTVEISVGEEADLSRLQITALTVNPEATFLVDTTACINHRQMPTASFESLASLPANANTRVDATRPFNIHVNTYQHYLWSVTVNQTIERYIEVDNQMGEVMFDVPSRRAIVYIEKGNDMTQVNIRRMKLEGGECTFSPDPATVHDFSRPRDFQVFREGKLLGTWTVDVQFSEQVSSTGAVTVRPRRATLSGGVKSGVTPVVEYRKQGAGEWTTLPAENVTMKSSVSFTASVGGLQESTTYEWRIVVDGVPGSAATFTTETIFPVPNLNFDTWTQSANGKNWYAGPVADNYDDPQAFWASGNEGVTMSVAGGNEATTRPVEGKDAVKGKAAYMTSISPVMLVGAAAGNLFIGTYKTNLGSPKDSPQFGRTFTGCHPDGLRGYYKYLSTPIVHGYYPGDLTMDEGHIYMRIWDAAGNEIAYGEHVVSESVGTYTPFEFRLKWTNANAEPATMTIVATSSRYGGEFEGVKVKGQVGAGSALWIDEFEIIYD